MGWSREDSAPNKLHVIRGGWFYYYLGLADSPASATSSFAQYPAEELYWSFGPPGALSRAVL
jgi:hypothetical protein